MQEWQRIVEDLFARLDGPLHFRFIVQPLMATIFAVIDGVKDAKAGKPPYFWALLSTPERRKEMMKEGWKSVGKIFILAMILDVIYQLKVHSTVYAGELLIVAFALAIVPYLVVRGPINRIVRIVGARNHKDADIAKVTGNPEPVPAPQRKETVMRKWPL